MSYIERLDWDSEFFGFSVGRTSVNRSTIYRLPDLLVDFRKKGGRLVYVFCSPDLTLENSLLREFNACLVDRKVTYIRRTAARVVRSACPYSIAFYTSRLPDAQLRRLAVESGKYSRFNLDERMPPGSFERLYNLWIEHSTDGSSGYRVMVVQHNGDLLGLITLGEKDGRGDIGLVAVSEKVRGQKIGTTLVCSSVEYFHKQAYPLVQVVTQ